MTGLGISSRITPLFIQVRRFKFFTLLTKQHTRLIKMENCSFNDTGWNGYTILGTETLPHHFRGSKKVEGEILVDFINFIL